MTKVVFATFASSIPFPIVYNVYDKGGCGEFDPSYCWRMIGSPYSSSQVKDGESEQAQRERVGVKTGKKLSLMQ